MQPLLNASKAWQTIPAGSLPSYAWNIFATFLHQMGPREPTKENAQLTRQNDIFHINQTSVLFNKDNT